MVDFQWLIGGEAGNGIMTTGVMMSKLFTRLGLSVFDYTEYPSLIRGGHNAYYVRASDVEIFSQKKEVEILVALNRETIDRHKHELSENACVIYDPTIVKIEEGEFPQDIKLFTVPLLEITRKEKASRFMMNTVSVGASIALLYDDYSIIQNLLDEIFGKKGEKVIQSNINLSKGGFDYVFEHFAKEFPMKIQKKPQENLLVGGIEAVTLGAIKAGLKFAAIYPMTPTSGIIPELAKHALEYSIIIKEPEDEISAINMAIGGGFAGVRSMVATSGGGFSLMVEGVGLAAQTETPIVIIMGMRPGPATGMPTWTSQADLRFMIHAAQDEFPRILLTPGDHIEAAYLTMKAFNLADKYQLPVIVLVDKYLMEGHKTVDISEMKNTFNSYVIERGKMRTDEDLANETDYKRYLLTDDGISPRSIPGQKGGTALSGSDEHDERGLYNEESENRLHMMEKRFKKLDIALEDLDPPQFFGWENADLTILSWGSSKMPIFEAMKWLKKDGISVSYLHITHMYPFPADEIKAVIQNSKSTLVIEGNRLGQFEGLVREFSGVEVDHHLRKYDGRPFYPEEIVEKVKSIIVK